MLAQLSIKNYALIHSLELYFDDGFITITGETGAGKSILLGALGLLLGERANLKSITNQQEKCSVEGVFNIKQYHLESFFEENDIDYEDQTIIRREITPAGKSRAFINDTPVLLEVLQQLGSSLISIHSQHDTAEVIHKSYHLTLLDSFAQLDDTKNKYHTQYTQYQSLQSEYKLLVNNQKTNNDTIDYKRYLLEELQRINLIQEEQAVLEEEQEILSHAETIKHNFSQSIHLYENDPTGIELGIKEINNSIGKIASFGTEINQFHTRLQSVQIELDDIMKEMIRFNEGFEYNPSRLEEIDQRLQAIYSLQKKHQVNTIEELLTIQQTLTKEVDEQNNSSEKIQELEHQIQQQETILKELAKELHDIRKAQSENLVNELSNNLHLMGMEQAELSIVFEKSATFLPTGFDQIEMVLKANTGATFQSLNKAASGGERSRLMLAIKKMLAQEKALPTMILDEIDTGVSGKIADQMGTLMHTMKRTTQLIVVTHLPQVAAKGNQQLKVYKELHEGRTQTYVKSLSKEERITEIAQMLSGSNITEAALQQASDLLENKS